MLREIRIEDKEDFISLMVEFYDTPAVNSVIDIKNHEKTFEHIINKNPLVEGYMITRDDKNIGYVLLANSYSNEIADTVVWLEHIYITEDYQGLGYGELVMRELHNELKGSVKSFRLEVSDDNKNLIDFYKRHGYTDRHYIQMHQSKK